MWISTPEVRVLGCPSGHRGVSWPAWHPRSSHLGCDFLLGHSRAARDKSRCVPPCARRALHKAHTGAVTELRLFSDTVNKVVSCGMDHSVFVYEVKEGPGAEEITIEPIVSYSLEVENKEGSIMTAAWHPLRQASAVPAREGSPKPGSA